MSRIKSKNYKRFNFKSSGQSVESQRKYVRDTKVVNLLGIKTPLELGSNRDGLFKMHSSLKLQIRDNLKNLLLTNKGERLGLYDFGTDLDELSFELAAEDFEQEALARITDNVSKFMPFIQIENIQSYNDRFSNEHTAKIAIEVTYGIPRLALTNQKIKLLIRVAG